MLNCGFRLMLTACLWVTVAASPLRAELTVFAAASLRGALDEVNQAYPDGPVTVSYASSAALARQVVQGAPADVFVSANTAWMDLVSDDIQIARETKFNLVSNSLVFVSARKQASFFHSDDALANIAPDELIAMGHVQAVPAGIYGRQALEASGHWDTLSGQVVQTDNVRAALRLVALGEADYGIVYLTDVQFEPTVLPVFTFSATDHQPIVYPAAALTDRLETKAYLSFLRSPEAQNIFKSFGFVAGDTK